MALPGPEAVETVVQRMEQVVEVEDLRCRTRGGSSRETISYPNRESSWVVAEGSALGEEAVFRWIWELLLERMMCMRETVYLQCVLLLLSERAGVGIYPVANREDVVDTLFWWKFCRGEQSVSQHGKQDKLNWTLRYQSDLDSDTASASRSASSSACNCGPVMWG